MQVGAEIVLGDRPQEITIKRLMFRAAQLAAERAQARRTPLSQSDSDIGRPIRTTDYQAGCLHAPWAQYVACVNKPSLHSWPQVVHEMHVSGEELPSPACLDFIPF